MPHAVEFGVDVVVPLLEPGEQLDQAGQQRNQARIVGAAELFLDVDVVGADRGGLLQVVVAGPADHQRAVFAFAVREADPAFLGDVQLAAECPVAWLRRVEMKSLLLYLGGTGIDRILSRSRSSARCSAGRLAATCELPSRCFSVSSYSDSVDVFAGTQPVFQSLQFPGLFPFGSFAEAGGLVAKDGQQRDVFLGDQFFDQLLDIEGGIVAVDFRRLP